MTNTTSPTPSARSSKGICSSRSCNPRRINGNLFGRFTAPETSNKKTRLLAGRDWGRAVADDRRCDVLFRSQPRWRRSQRGFLIHRDRLWLSDPPAPDGRRKIFSAISSRQGGWCGKRIDRSAAATPIRRCEVAAVAMRGAAERARRSDLPCDSASGAILALSSKDVGAVWWTAPECPSRRQAGATCRGGARRLDGMPAGGGERPIPNLLRAIGLRTVRALQLLLDHPRVSELLAFHQPPPRTLNSVALSLPLSAGAGCVQEKRLCRWRC